MSRSASNRRRALAGAVALGLSMSSLAVAATTATWLSPTSGNWSDPTKWSTNPNYPNNDTPAGVTYDAIIGAMGSPYTVALDASTQPQGTLAVDSVSLNSSDSTLSLTGGTLQTARLNLNGGKLQMALGTRLKNATIGGIGGQAYSGAGTFDSVTIASDLTTGDWSGVYVDNGLTLDHARLTLSSRNVFRNAQTIGGNGTIAMTRIGHRPELYISGGAVTVGAEITLEGGGQIRGGSNLVNNGSIRANSDTDWMDISGWSGNSTVNNGLMEATQGALGPRTLILGDVINTNGIIRAAGGRVIIEQVAGPNIGTLEATNGGSIIINRIFGNQGNTVTATPTTGNLQVGEVYGGTLATSGGAEFSGTGGTWYNVTLAGSRSVYTTFYGGSLRADVLTLSDGTIRLFGASGAPSAYASLQADKLAGTGQVVFEGNSELNLVHAYPATLTLSQGVTVRTGTGGGTVSADNYGSVVSQTAGRTITLGRFVNYGTVRATSQGMVTSGAPAEVLNINHGTLTADGGGTMTLPGNWSNGADGTLAVAAGGTLSLVGTWSSAGAISVTGGTLNLGGTFPTPAGTFSRSGGVVNVTGTLNNTSRTLALGANTGSWNVTSTGKVVGGTLTTTAGASLVGQGNTARLESLNIAGQVDVPVAITLFNSTIGGTGIVNVAAGATLNASGTWSNAGTIAADGGTLRLNDNWSNNGTISATNDGSLETAGAWSNPGGMINASGAALLKLGGASTNIGSINATNASIDVIGSFATQQLLAINRTNSTIALKTGGNVLNAGDALTISPAFPLQLRGGTISGGVLQTGGGLSAVAVQESMTFDGVTIDTTVNVAPAKTLSLARNWDNNGVIQAYGATLALGGAFAQSNIGMIERNSGTNVHITGMLNNAASTFAIDGIGTWRLMGGTIDGGTVAAPSGATFYIGSMTSLSAPATLSGGVTLSGSIVTGRTTVTVQDGLSLAAGTTLALTGTFGSSGVLSFAGTQTLDGSGEIIFDGVFGGGAVRPAGSGSVLTVGPGITVRTGTQGGVIGASSTTFVSQGLISSRTAGKSISINGNVTNNGTIELRNGGSIVAGFNPPGSFTNYANNTLTGGTWEIYAGSTLTMTNASITTNAADVVLSGPASTFAAIAAMVTNNGNLAILAGRDFTTASSLANAGTLVAGVGSDWVVSGDLTTTLAATLAVELLSDLSDETFGQFAVTGSAALAGSLEVLLAPDFDLEIGDVFTVLTAAEVSGTFDQVILPSNLTTNVLYSPTTVQLQVTAVPEPGMIGLAGMGGLALIRRRREERRSLNRK